MLRIMFFTFLVISFGCLGLTFGNPANIAKDLAILRVCNASNPVSLDSVNAVLIHQNMQHYQAQTENFKCFLLCLYVQYQWMDDDGGFKLHGIKSTLLAAEVPDHRIRLLLYTCTSTESTNPCDRATIFTECFWSHNKNDSENGTTRFSMK